MSKKVVLVTGASSGIGKACALRLARDGWTVFGGVRRPQDGEALRREAGENLVPILLDVTDEDSLQAAVPVVTLAAAGGTFALVNNAGITVAGPLEVLPTAELRRQFDVNLFGPLAVTRAFLPLLRAAHGRVLLMGSIFGRISLPFVAPYTAAKAALGAIAESLSLELRAWRIPVVLLEPGNISTPIWTRTKASVIETLGRVDQEKVALYQGALSSFEKLTDAYAGSGIPPARVATVVARALAARRPRLRYTVGWDSRVLGRLAPMLPARFRQWILAGMTLRR